LFNYSPSASLHFIICSIISEIITNLKPKEKPEYDEIKNTTTNSLRKKDLCLYLTYISGITLEKERGEIVQINK
jgi:hypothetical protein